MKKTPLYQEHISLNSKMVQFAGFDMPIQYSGIIHEHHAVRKACGIFDVSHMGEFMVSGEGAESFLNRMTINDISHLSPGQAQYSVMCYHHGGIIDDILIYKFDQKYMLVVNASNLEKDYQWLLEHKPENVQLTNISDETGLIAVQGPKSRSILHSCLSKDISQLIFYTFIEDNSEGNNLVIARTGYTGELGFEIYGDPDLIRNIWKKLMDTSGVTPCGLGCRDTLRMEMKFCLYGNDIDETTNPIEAGLGWITKLNKSEFIGKDALLAAKENRARRLVAFEMEERAVPRHGYTLHLDGKEIRSSDQRYSITDAGKGNWIGICSGRKSPDRNRD